MNNCNCDPEKPVECNCIITQLVNGNKKHLQKYFQNMNYGDSMILDIENVFSSDFGDDFGNEYTLIGVKKTEYVDVDPHFCYERNDVIDRELKPGLEFYRSSMPYSFDHTLFRLNFDISGTKVSHYRSGGYGWEICNTFPEDCLENQSKYLLRFLIMKSLDE